MDSFPKMTGGEVMESFQRSEEPTRGNAGNVAPIDGVRSEVECGLTIGLSAATTLKKQEEIARRNEKERDCADEMTEEKRETVPNTGSNGKYFCHSGSVQQEGTAPLGGPHALLLLRDHDSFSRRFLIEPLDTILLSFSLLT